MVALSCRVHTFAGSKLKRGGVRTGLERRIGLRDIARHGGEERDGVLGGSDGVGGGCVDDEAAGLGGRLEVDIVDAHGQINIVISGCSRTHVKIEKTMIIAKFSLYSYP